MYKVFFDNKKIWVTNNLRKARKKKGKLFSLTTLSVKDFLKKVEKAKSGKFVFYIDKGEDFFSYFTSALICIEAGGGVVRNQGTYSFYQKKRKMGLTQREIRSRRADRRMCSEGSAGRDCPCLPTAIRTEDYHLPYIRSGSKILPKKNLLVQYV